MNTKDYCYRIILTLLSLFLYPFVILADEPYCNNLGFESGNFTNWTGYSWQYSDDAPAVNSPKVEGLVFRRHSIMSDTTAYDEFTGGLLKIVPRGYRYCARLGDVINRSYDSSPRCWQQSLRYQMTVDSSNSLLIMKFACVLQYDDEHTAAMEPRFKLTLFDDKGDTIRDCANYDVYTSSTLAQGFQTYTHPDFADPIQWRDWTTVGANLLPYIGKTITIEFMSADCTGHFHFGYAYFVAQCHPMAIAVKYCAGDTAAVLTAPEGFKSYRWENNQGQLVHSEQVYKIENPSEGASYSCTMNSATGCQVSLSAKIIRYDIKADFSNYMLDCASNQVQFTNLSTTTNGHLTYEWDFGQGETSALQDPQIKFPTSGIHTVTLNLKNPPSECVKSLTRDVESFSPPLVGIGGDSTYCPGETLWIKAHGAHHYLWNTGSTRDSIEAGSPGGSFWMIGYSSNGCTSDTSRIQISEEPPWEFSIDGKSDFCQGDSTQLTAAGATSYLWNTGDTTASIYALETDRYTVIGKNKRGCQQEISFDITRHLLPDVDFTLSSPTIDSRHNQLTCSITPEDNTAYSWTMGDGTTLSGSTVAHTYNQLYSVSNYQVTLTAISGFNCSDSLSKSIDVIPFIPNVFSPNLDGINDRFAQGMETEIFDRNGLFLFSGTDGWDGTYHNKALSPDTYFYRIGYVDKTGTRKTVKGFITLIR